MLILLPFLTITHLLTQEINKVPYQQCQPNKFIIHLNLFFLQIMEKCCTINQQINCCCKIKHCSNSNLLIKDQFPEIRTYFLFACVISLWERGIAVTSHQWKCQKMYLWLNNYLPLVCFWFDHHRTIKVRFSFPLSIFVAWNGMNEEGAFNREEWKLLECHWWRILFGYCFFRCCTLFRNLVLWWKFSIPLPFLPAQFIR